MSDERHRTLRVAAAAAALAAAATSYMVFEAQWPRCRQADLDVSGLPSFWAGTTLLHLSDVHAGLFPTNELSLRKVVDWAVPLEPDLVFLTGDMLGDPRRGRACLETLARLKPPLGMFAVTGNHEYGLGKGPLARARDTTEQWTAAGVTLLRDSCIALRERGRSANASTPLVICGADYLTGGFGLLQEPLAPGLPVLLIHQPPPSDSGLAAVFPLAFAGHTHGGQLRVPSPTGLTPVNDDKEEHLAGVYEWGRGRLVVSRGVGTSFLPFRLLTRPEATLWRLV